MFFLVPRITVLLLVVFALLMVVRGLRRRRFRSRPPRLVRWARSAGRRRARRRRDQSESFRPS